MKKIPFALLSALILLASCHNTPVKSLSITAPAVDLGLSVEWAEWNIGATAPSEIGAYFAWGEKSDKQRYTWPSYTLCNGSDSTIFRYNGADGLRTIQPEDDAATANWGHLWRIPTEKEWLELKEKCTWEPQGNGVRITGPNGRSIFLPYTGYYNPGSEVFHPNAKTSSLDNKDKGYYWSSTIGKTNTHNARSFEFNAEGSTTTGTRRCCGLAIRPVRK